MIQAGAGSESTRAINSWNRASHNLIARFSSVVRTAVEAGALDQSIGFLSARGL
jgi:hypothetical protein